MWENQAELPQVVRNRGYGRERWVAAEQVEDRAAERVDIDLVPVVSILLICVVDLRRQEPVRAHHGRPGHALRASEVDQLQLQVLGDHEVLRLDVPVQNR